jgi:uncharacterized protein (TIGR03437 family)
VRYQALDNSATGLPELSPGALASLFGARLTGGDPGSVRVLIGGAAARLLAVSDGQINLQIPEEAAVGTAELVVTGAAGSSDPMLIRLDRSSPGLFAALDSAGAWTTALTPRRPAAVLATGLGPAAAKLKNDGTLLPVQIVIGGVRLAPTRIEPFATPGTWLVGFDVPDLLAGATRVALLVDGRASNELSLSVR